MAYKRTCNKCTEEIPKGSKYLKVSLAETIKGKDSYSTKYTLNHVGDLCNGCWEDMT